MGNTGGKVENVTNTEDNHTDAITKIKHAREQYLKKLLEEEEDQPDSRHAAKSVSDKMYQRSTKAVSLSETDLLVMQTNPKDYDYPFENIVFEGGGSKGVAYGGAIKALEDYGLIKQLKRISGTSAGAMTAALLAVGYSADEINEINSLDMQKIFLDASILRIIPNLLRGYGWHPGNGIYDWFGDAIAAKCYGKKDITFLELYQMRGIELCIVVTNLNLMIEEYCHVKTTPNMPIRLAVRMSMGIPGVYQAVPRTENGETNFYIDGGVLCNYPIHCFDGWWLSMRPGDSFIERLQPLDQIPQLLDRKYRFKYDPDKNKTIGLLLYADSDEDMYRYKLEQRIGLQIEEYPKTKLARKRLAKKSQHAKEIKEHKRVIKAADFFLKVLKKNNANQNEVIDRSEFENAFNDEEFTSEHANLLFGEDCTPKMAFDSIDSDGDGEIYYHELVLFFQSTGISLQQRFQGYKRQEITGLFSFFGTLEEALLANVKKLYVQELDIDRTVGINTGYIGTTDFVFEPEDLAFASEQGKKSMESFLKYYAVVHKLKKRSDVKVKEERSSTDDQIDDL